MKYEPYDKLNIKLSNIIENARVDVNGNICFLNQVFTEIRLFFETRKQMFRLVYRHTVVLKVEAIIRKIIGGMDLIQLMENWMDFDDTLLLYYLKKSDMYRNIYLRSFCNIDIAEPFKHCILCTDEDINNQIIKVPFI
jgi:HD superfamily phosphohydrolase